MQLEEEVKGCDGGRPMKGDGEVVQGMCMGKAEQEMEVNSVEIHEKKRGTCYIKKSIHPHLLNKLT